jgi:hypothetical protein
MVDTTMARRPDMLLTAWRLPDAPAAAGDTVLIGSTPGAWIEGNGTAIALGSRFGEQDARISMPQAFASTQATPRSNKKIYNF